MKRVLIRIVGGFVVFNVVIAAAALVVRWLMPSAGDEESDEVAVVAALNGIDIESRARAFRGGSAHTVMGGIQLDLRGATLDPTGGRLELLAVMGGIQLIVPDTWRVRIEPSYAIVGGIDTPRHKEDVPDTEPALEIASYAVLGGIQVAKRPAAPAAATALAPAGAEERSRADQTRLGTSEETEPLTSTAPGTSTQ